MRNTFFFLRPVNIVLFNCFKNIFKIKHFTKTIYLLTYLFTYLLIYDGF